MGPDTDAFKVFTAMGMTDQKNSADALMDAGRSEAYTRHSNYKLDGAGAVVISEGAPGAKPTEEVDKFSQFADGIHLGHFSIAYDAAVQGSHSQHQLSAKVEMDKPFLGSDDSFHIEVSDGRGKPLQVVDGSFSSKTGTCDEVIKDPSGNVLVKAHSTSDGMEHPNNFTIETEYSDASGKLIGSSHQAVTLDSKTHEMTVDTTATKDK